MTKPRILFIHDFDPAAVMLGWRDLLRSHGWDAYAGVAALRYHGGGYDSECPKPDVIVVCPGIADGGGWSNTDEPGHWDAIPSWVCKELTENNEAKGIALFHGSRNTWANRKSYASYWQETWGFTIAATTLDYATEMQCAWLPPIVKRARVAEFHDPKDPIIVLQTPTCPEICSTQDFLHAVREAGAIPIVSNCQPHHRNLWLKTRFPCGFDHLRGSFSVNALENAACGQASIFGLSPACRERLEAEKVSAISTAIECTREALEAKVRSMVVTPETVARAQTESLEWWETNFSAEPVFKRLETFFSMVMEESSK